MKYLALLCLSPSPAFAADYPAPKEGDYTTKNFKFRNGESLPELRLHYATIGAPHRDARGQIANAVLILHGTGGTGKQFLQPQFADELFGPGQPLDATRYYIILPDNIGHGGSSKPSNGLHMRFPKYDYDDMVAAQHLLLTEGLGVEHLRLIFGTSMGCMHSFVWGETYPDFMDALMPMACQTVADRRAQSHVAQGGDRFHQARSGVEQRRIQGRAGQRPALRRLHPGHRRQRAARVAEAAIRRATTPTSLSRTRSSRASNRSTPTTCSTSSIPRGTTTLRPTWRKSAPR